MFRLTHRSVAEPTQNCRASDASRKFVVSNRIRDAFLVKCRPIARWIMFMRRRSSRLNSLSVALLFVLAPIVRAGDADDLPDQRLRNAHASFHEMMVEPDKGIPLSLFDKAECIVIIPGVKKGAF